VLRPLLAVARADTAAYCAEQGLRPVGEPPGHYRRDRVREELLPALERYNPRVRHALAATATALVEERAALDAWTRALLERLPRGAGQVRIPLAEWRALPPAMRKRLLRAAALPLADGQAGRGLDLPAGLRLEREPDALRLRLRRAPDHTLAGEWALPVP